MRIYSCAIPAYCILAAVMRNGDLYHLHIQENGQITCFASGSSPDPNICAKLGFDSPYF